MAQVWALPQGYKRWPSLRKGERCGNLFSTGKIPEAAAPCGNPAAEIVMILDDDGPWLWESMCASCLQNFRVSPFVLTKKRFATYKRRSRAT